MKRSRSNHLGFAGLCFRKRVHNTYAIGAASSGSPGCPLFAFCTASIESARIVLILSWSTSEVVIIIFPSCHFEPSLSARNNIPIVNQRFSFITTFPLYSFEPVPKFGRIHFLRCASPAVNRPTPKVVLDGRNFCLNRRPQRPTHIGHDHVQFHPREFIVSGCLAKVRGAQFTLSRIVKLLFLRG